jgi:hypothetical protein
MLLLAKLVLFLLRPQRAQEGALEVHSCWLKPRHAANLDLNEPRLRMKSCGLESETPRLFRVNVSHEVLQTKNVIELSVLRQ